MRQVIHSTPIGFVEGAIWVGAPLALGGCAPIAVAAGHTLHQGLSTVPGADTTLAVLTLLLLGSTLAVAGWYWVSVVLARLALLLRGSQNKVLHTLATWLVRSLVRWGAPFARKMLLTAALVSLGGGTAFASAALPNPDLGPGSTSSTVLAVEIPQDLGPGNGTSSLPTILKPGSSHLPDPTESAPSPATGSSQPTTGKPASVKPAPSPAPAVASPTPAGPAPNLPENLAPGRQHPTSVNYLVQPGDSLWRICERHLGPQATDREVAREWPRWWQANRAVIGPNPDRIFPGQVLTIPAEEQS